jgi:RNA polymerase sigma factor (sigma-70 family)
MTATADAGGRRRPKSLGLGLSGDERLARQAGAGDVQAFEIVYERYHGPLYGYCRSILRNDADAQDALQSTFAAAFAALRTGQRDAPIRPWLFRIAHNESISVLRRRRPAFELSAASEHGTASVEDEVAGRAQVSLLWRDLRELTDRQRSALVLRELSGLSHEEVAIALGTSVGGARQMIFEARQSLFEFAEGRDLACDEIRRTISDADGRSLRARRVRAHLRECTPCAAFAAAIPARTGELRAIAPVLPALAAGGLLDRIALASAGGRSAHGLARLAASAAGKSATAGAGFGANALAGVAVVASATVGVTVGVDKFVRAANPAAAARGRGPAVSATPKTAGPSSPLLGPPFPVGTRSASGRDAAAAEHAAGVGAGATMPSIALRLRTAGSLTGASGLRSTGAGAPGPSTALSSAGGQAGGAAARSGSDAAGRRGNGESALAGAGNPSFRGSSGSGSSGSGKSASQGSGRHGSGGSGNSASSGSGNSASGGHHPLLGVGGAHTTANAPGLVNGSVSAVDNPAMHAASAVSNPVAR